MKSILSLEVLPFKYLIKKSLLARLLYREIVLINKIIYNIIILLYYNIILLCCYIFIIIIFIVIIVVADIVVYDLRSNLYNVDLCNLY